ncbi:hypothetical protein [Cernens ardua]
METVNKKAALPSSESAACGTYQPSMFSIGSRKVSSTRAKAIQPFSHSG